MLALLVAPARADEASGIMNLPKWSTASDELGPIVKRRLVRILVQFSKTQFFADTTRIYGITVETGRELEMELNKRYGRRSFNIRVEYLPTRRDRLLDDLIAGRGDIAAGSLTITPERAALVDFLDPWVTGVKEVVVLGPASPPLSTLDDLSHKEIRVRTSSSYFTHLRALSDDLVARGLAPIQIRPISEDLFRSGRSRRTSKTKTSWRWSTRGCFPTLSSMISKPRSGRPSSPSSSCAKTWRSIRAAR
jgi:ABC-type amino acid transport substrate-binding protein